MDNRVRAIQESGKVTTVQNRRNELLATADVRLVQAQVINKRSELINIVIWQCGPDVLWARTMQDFAAGNLFTAPKWLREQLSKLTPSQTFDFRGRPLASPGETIQVPAEASGDAGLDDIDAPGVLQG